MIPDQQYYIVGELDMRILDTIHKNLPSQGDKETLGIMIKRTRNRKIELSSLGLSERSLAIVKQKMMKEYP